MSSSSDQIISIEKIENIDFSHKHVADIFGGLRHKPSSFSVVVVAFLGIFSSNHDYEPSSVEIKLYNSETFHCYIV